MPLKINRLARDFAVLFIGSSALAFIVFKDHTQETEKILQSRPDVLRMKKQHNDVVKLIRNSAENKGEEEQIVRELVNKGK